MSNIAFCYCTIIVFLFFFTLSVLYICLWLKKRKLFNLLSQKEPVFDSLRLHRTVILMMSCVMTADDELMLRKKSVALKYIRFVSKNKKEREETCAFFDKSLNKDLDCHDLAVELSKHLNPFQRKYISFLLLSIANIDGTISSYERNLLDDLCVNGLQISSMDFVDMCMVCENGQLNDWFNRNILACQPSLAVNEDGFINIFDENGASAVVTWSSSNYLLVDLNRYIYAFIIPFFVLLIINGNALQGLLSILTFGFLLFVIYFSMVPLSYSDVFGTIFICADIDYSSKCLRKHGLMIFLSVILFFVSIPASFYNFADNRYSSGVIPVQTKICSKCYHEGDKHSHSSYIFYFPELEANSIQPPVQKNLQPIEKFTLSALDKLTIPYFKSSIGEENDVSVSSSSIHCVSVDKFYYNAHQENDSITILVRKGYFNKNIYVRYGEPMKIYYD